MAPIVPKDKSTKELQGYHGVLRYTLEMLDVFGPGMRFAVAPRLVFDMETVRLLLFVVLI